MSFDFEAQYQCTECSYQFFMDLDEKPYCPKCKGVKVIEILDPEIDPLDDSMDSE